MNRKTDHAAVKRKSPPKARRAPAQKKIQYPHFVEFPQVKGRTVEMVELNLDSDFH